MDPQDLAKINQILDDDVELREKIKEQVTEFDKKIRTMVGLLNKIHSAPAHSIPDLLDTVRPNLMACQKTCAALASIVPPNEFWRWKEMWTNSLRNLVFVAVLMEYLANGKLIEVSRLSKILGIKEEWKNRFFLPIEDYLHGVVAMVNELSRLAINSVTLGNFEEPIRISLFVKEIFAGFTMLNLKNDSLRRRFDSLKYDIKKVEEVVYDVSLRKLAPPTAQPTLPIDGCVLAKS